MIIGIGMDLVEVQRVDRLLRRHPARARDRLFTAAEVAHCGGARSPAESFAARFAAKEALFKALGTGWSGGASWREAEVVTDPEGAPRLRMHGRTRRLAEDRGVVHVHVSLTHTRELAGAYVVLEGVPAEPAVPAPGSTDPRR
jgi:holo-[acyl-carrier protein] synthase